MNQTGLPIAAIIQPLSQENVPLIQEGPIRCSRCMAYINPHFTWLEGGKKQMCNICLYIQEVPQNYYYSLDEYNQRRDKNQRPELSKGVYEFIAPPEYTSKKVQIPTYFLCIELSVNSVQSGLVGQIIASVKSILDYIQTPVKIGICTFNNSIQFYRLIKSGEPQIVIVSDMMEPFVPFPFTSFCGDVQEDREQLDALLQYLTEIASIIPQNSQSGLCSVVKAMTQLLSEQGAQMLLFFTQLPTMGIGQLRKVDNPSFYNTEKEKLLYQKKDETYYDLVKECVEKGLSIDLFIFPYSYIDVASVAPLSVQTGGEIYLYPQFSSQSSQGIKLHFDLVRNITRQQGYQVILRARCSNGLSVQEYLGNYYRKTVTDCEMTRLDEDKTLSILLQYDSKIKEGELAHLQVAMLYTNMSGQRLIRVINGAVLVANSMATVFRSADMEAICNIMIRKFAFMIYSTPVKQIREKMHKQTQVLIQCAAQTSNAQLVLPDTLKLMPLYMQSSFKNPCLSMVDVNGDLRMYYLYKMNSMPLAHFCYLIYPRLYQIHDLLEQPHNPGTKNANNNTLLPINAPNSLDKISSSGVYLVDNCEQLLLFVGEQVDAELLNNIFGVNQIEEVESLQPIQSEFSEKLWEVINWLNVSHNAEFRQPAVHVFSEKQELTCSKLQSILRRILVEDKTPALEQSYVEFLCNLHHVIQQKIQNS